MQRTTKKPPGLLQPDGPICVIAFLPSRVYSATRIFLIYLTTTLVASPSTATTTIPAGTAIVTLSEAATWLAIV